VQRVSWLARLAPRAETMTAASPAAARKTASPLRLVLAAIGGPAQIAGKLRRLGRTARLWTDRAEVRRRLDELQRRGFIPGPIGSEGRALRAMQPNRWQLVFGGLDMLRFVIEPAARDYYRQQGISFGFHQLLRVLDDPVSMIDPTGFLSERDTIIGHVMQVVHLNPIYDLQLLQMFPDGLDELEAQVAAMVAGTHPRRGTIGAIVEDPTYHARLLDYVRRFRADPDTEPLVRAEQTLRSDPTFAAAERTFATLPGFIAYCNRLPAGFGALLARSRRIKQFPVELATR
jgi:hypothetical protein